MRLSLFLLTFLITACSSPLKQDLNFQEAETLVRLYEKTGKIDSVLLEKSNAQQFISKDGFHLFVVNSFNGDFNGYVYSESKGKISIHARFGDLYIRSTESTTEKWTKVFGGW